MFIELLVVSAILMYLYSVGILNFSSPYAIVLSAGIVLVAGGLSWALTHYLARRLVDGMFGFDAWSPRKPAKLPSDQRLAIRDLGVRALPALEKLAHELPHDLEASRLLSEEYLRQGMTEKFIAERMRILQAATLSREEQCSIYNRLADAVLNCQDYERAVGYLRTICERFPGTVEAQNALRRITVIQERAANDGRERDE